MTTTSAGNGRPKGGGEGGGRRRGKGTTALASERREHLVRLAAELFAKKGFQATTVREIADEAGILSGSLYHHFDSKESIVDEVLSTFFDELLTANRAAVEEGGDPREILSALVRIAFGTLEPHRAAITVMQNDWNYLSSLPRFGYLTKAEEETESIWIGQIKRGQETGLFRPDIDARLTYRMIRDTIWVAIRWFRPGGRFGADSLAEHYLKVLFDGICTH
ncbi:MAG TPA: TetR/AcrR family transcriptional regulator [Streptosporangiaceae bacterium]|nr:TetR/AcrR family transcriptional regulator [Streptosporangiaceae bacterium]